MGNERYDKEVRQIGGVMMICSLAVMTFPILDTTNRISLPILDDPMYDEETNENWILNWVLLAGDLCVVALGLLGMGVGFMAVTDSGSKLLTVFAIIWEQTAFIDWIGKMYNLSLVGKFPIVYCLMFLSIEYRNPKLTLVPTFPSRVHFNR